MIVVHAPAKLNLSLRVRPPDATGWHPLRSLVQTIGWWDVLTLGESDEDHLEVVGADLPVDGDNLVWKAITTLREEAKTDRQVTMTLTKRIPTAAGLGGGSSDAAGALVAYADLLAFSPSDLAELAAAVGADVPYLLEGGSRLIEGYGELLSPKRPLTDDYWVVVAVPPFELSTSDVYRRWDRLAGPDGPAMGRRSTPPSLRGEDELINDLYPAAVSLEPLVDDWRADLSGRWQRDVALSGSGPSLFGLFSDRQEAVEALALVPGEARSVFASAPVDHGAIIVDG